MNPNSPKPDPFFGNQPTSDKEEQQHSAGGVVYKKEGGRYKICLVAKRGGKVWALPKGRLNDGETPRETALREILEETGHRVEIIDQLDEIHYYFLVKETQTLFSKRVSFFLMKLIEQDAQPRDDENDIVSWFEFSEALRRLSYLNEKKVVKLAMGILK